MDVDLTTLKKTDKKKDTSNHKWTKEQEELLASWSERAAGYRWLHSRSEKLYRCRNYTFTIPVIILSTLTGTANFAMDSFVPESHKQMAMACVGGVNIFAGILSTLQNFLRYAELMESHRVCEVSWSKLSRDIAVELTLEPKMRKPAFDFLNVCRAEYDRLIEQSPPIDDDIIKKYKGEFDELDEDFNHPLVCNGLHKCRVFIPSEDDKKAHTVATAGEKLLNLKRNKWNNDINTEFKRKIIVKPDKIKKTDINEELKSLNSVSQFKKSFNEGNNFNEGGNLNEGDNGDNDNDKHPMEKINEIIKNSNQDLNKDIEIGIKEPEENLDEIKEEISDNNEEEKIPDNLDDKKIELKINFLDKKD